MVYLYRHKIIKPQRKAERRSALQLSVHYYYPMCLTVSVVNRLQIF